MSLTIASSMRGRARPRSWRAWTRIAATFLIIVGLAVRLGGVTFGYLSQGRPTASTILSRVPRAGMHVPNFRLPSAQGGVFDLARSHGHVVLLSFLRTQPDTLDTPSRRQAVSLTSMAHQYGPKGVQVVIVDASAAQVTHMPARNALVNTTFDWRLTSIPLLMDRGSDTIARQYGVDQAPTTFLIGRNGRLVQRWNGYITASLLALTLQTQVGPPVISATTRR